MHAAAYAAGHADVDKFRRSIPEEHCLRADRRGDFPNTALRHNAWPACKHSAVVCDAADLFRFVFFHLFEKFFNF